MSIATGFDLLSTWVKANSIRICDYTFLSAQVIIHQGFWSSFHQKFHFSLPITSGFNRLCQITMGSLISLKSNLGLLLPVFSLLKNLCKLGLSSLGLFNELLSFGQFLLILIIFIFELSVFFIHKVCLFKIIII